MSATITWLGQSAFRVTLPDGRIIWIDPWLEENPACPANLKTPTRGDLIVLTRGHPDPVDDVPEWVRRLIRRSSCIPEIESVSARRDSQYNASLRLEQGSSWT